MVANGKVMEQSRNAVIQDGLTQNVGMVFLQPMMQFSVHFGFLSGNAVRV